MSFLRKHWLLIACIAVAVLKVVFSTQLPLCIHAEALYDDRWAVNAADTIAHGKWLGEYDDITLIKNVGYPLFLALLMKLHVSCLLGTAVLNALAAVALSMAVKPLFKKNGAWFLLYLALMFMPVSFATDTFQRVYRNSIVAAQAMLIFAAYLGAYLRIKPALGDPEASPWRTVLKVLPWMLVGAVSLAWFWISREDSIWVLPFAGVATVVMAVLLVKRAVLAKGGVGALLVSLVLLVLPLGATAASITAVKSLNQSHYGLATTAEINSGEFARFIKDLYAIQPQEMPANLHVAAPHTSVVAAYQVSPTLASIEEAVEERFYNWGDRYDNDKGDGEVNGGEFFWVFRLAGSRAGVYTSAPAAEAFWGQCADEIEAAFADGRLEQRDVMPSSIMTPWRAEYASMLLPAAAGIYAQAASGADVTAAPWQAQGPERSIAHFESVTRNDRFQVVVDFAEQPTPEEEAAAIASVVADPASWPAASRAAQALTWVYRILGSILGVAGLAALVGTLVQWVRQHHRARKSTGLLKAKTDMGPAALVLTALFLGVLALIAGLTYSRVSSFTPISYYYYGSAAYPLLLTMNITAVAAFVQSLRAGRGGEHND